MLDVVVEGNPDVALLDAGAKPSVIDAITLREFGLAHRERKKGSQVFGLRRAAVAFSGQVEVEIDTGNDQRVIQCPQVIDVEEPTFILRPALSQASNIVSYIDDCLVYSKGFRKQLDDIRYSPSGIQVS